MEELKRMKDQMISVVQGQLTHLDCVDTKELGEAMDIIKDLSEAEYYCSITKAMEETEKNGGAKEWNEQYYQQEPRYYTPRMRYPRDWEEPIMYYGGNGGSMQNGSSSYARMAGRRMYEPYEMYDYSTSADMPHYPQHRDYREGRSYESRKGYMESKEMHKDANTQMKELEKYMKDLSQDITEMIVDATPAEKQTLKQKMTTLIEKIG